MNQSFETCLTAALDEHERVVQDFRQQCTGQLEQLAQVWRDALAKGNKICFFGNGGSAADAQHLAAELVVRFVKNRQGLPSIAFTTDSSILTACANDFGYEEVFARQVEALCVPGDVVVGISTSGTSANVVRALAQAGGQGVTRIAFTGADAALCGEHSEYQLTVPSSVTARIQECHIIAGHVLCGWVEDAAAASVE